MGLKNKSLIIAIAVILYIALFAYFYPQFYLVTDEQIYSQQTQYLLEGSLREDNLSNSGSFNVFEGKYAVPRNPIGNALLLSPFLAIGFKFQFVLGALLHLIAFYFIILFLKRYKISEYYALLYLFNPIFLNMSQYIYSDFPSAVCLLIGSYYFTNSRTFLKLKYSDIIISSILFSLMILTRYQNVLFILPHLMYAFLEILKHKSQVVKVHYKKSILFAIPFVILGGFIGWYNWYQFGNPFSVGYGLLVTLFDVRFSSIVNTFIAHFIMMLVILPFSVLLLFVDFVKIRDLNLFRYSLWIGLVFYSLSWVSPKGLAILDVLGIRFIFPAFLLFSLVYIVHIEHFRRKSKPWLKKLFILAFIGYVVLGIVVSFFAMQVHHDKTDIVKSMSESFYENTPEGSNIILNGQGDIIFHNSFGERNILLLEPGLGVYQLNKTPIINDWSSCYYVESGNEDWAFPQRKPFLEKNSQYLTLVSTDSFTYANLISQRDEIYTVSIYEISDCSQITYTGFYHSPVPGINLPPQ